MALAWISVLSLIVTGLSVLGIAHNEQFFAPQPTHAPLPSAVVYTPASTIQDWKPRIAFQYYDGNEPSAALMAEKLDWLMMRYGAEQRREEVYANGYRGLILQYVLAYQILGPGPYKNKNARCKNNYTPLRNNAAWAGDFCKNVHPHEGWFLHNSKGERLYNKQRNWDGTYIYDYYMNPASKGFRTFWISQIQKQQEASWRGFFLDNVGVDYEYLRKEADNQDGVVKEFGSNEKWQAALTDFIDHIRANFPDHPIWGNMIEANDTPDAWLPFLDHLDGFQEESFATNWVGQRPLSPDAWEAQLVRAEMALAQGKGVVLYGQGTQDDLQRMRFSLASYLLIATADERATFRYAQTSEYLSLWWYPEYDRNLGLPKGQRRREGSLWVRDFQCGRVTVDPTTQVGTIEQQPCTV